jgi:predicted lipid-binding transport protein (Tim44 family)
MLVEVTMRPRALVLISGLTLISLLAIDTAAVFARAGSGGSRGSRSYSAPASPSSPSRATPSPSYSPSPQPQRPGGMFGGLMGGLAGFALGGLLGSMLFGGLGGGFGGGLGLLELLLIGGAIFFLFKWLRGRQASPAYAMGGGGSASAYGADRQGWSSGGGAAAATLEAPPSASVSDLDRGLGHIRSMDASFDPDAFAEWAKSVFADVQAGVARRDMSAVQERLTPQQYGRLQAQCDQLRGARHTNRIEQVRVNRAQLSEAWQESGQDWATVYFAVSLVDYTVDDGTGAVVEGSKNPVEIEEYWTFTRPVGPKPWRLSAIQTA